jgi:phytoene/squalene synthetase
MGLDVSNKTNKNDIAYAVDQIRRHLPDRYRILPFLSEAQRNIFIPLQSLRSELSQIRLRTTEPIMGQIRLKWWMEAVEQIENDRIEDHPIIRLIAKASHGDIIDPSRVIEMISSHEVEVEQTIPDDIQDFYHRAIRMERGGIHLFDCKAIDELAGILGVTRMLLEFDTRSQAGLCPLPRNLIKDAGLKLTDFQSGNDDIWPAVKEILLSIAIDAKKRLNKVESAIQPAVLIKTLIHQQLKFIIKYQGNVLHPRVGVIPPFLFLKLTWAAWTK